jgi:hypothetical protein
MGGRDDSVDRSRAPTTGVDLILGAAAQTYGVLAEDVASASRARALTRARAVFVALGRLEGYRDHQLAGIAGRTRQRIGQLGAHEVDMLGVQIARTLLRLDVFRARLKPPKLSRAASYAGSEA